MSLEQLNSFNADTRRETLDLLFKKEGGKLPAPGNDFNMHCHSFFSYNADGWSPTRIAWEGRKAGWFAAGLCDFDVLDGVSEFLDTGLTLGLRTSAHLETRAFFKEFSSVDISSPGEAGVTYIMGAGFTGIPAQGTPQAAFLNDLSERAGNRNRSLVKRINAALPEIAVNYEEDVVPSTPGGTPTERHIVTAYAQKAASNFKDPSSLRAFWGKVFALSDDKVSALLENVPALEDTIRSKLVKRGGIGYEQPSENTFPAVDDFCKWVASCGAIPMTTWLDGTSGGESDPDRLLDCMGSKCAAALNIIPDRNWNLKNPEEREIKRRHLKAMVDAAAKRNLPVNIGTEMNKQGLPFVDSMSGEVLRDYATLFRTGASIMVGHTLLLRFADFGYVGEKAESEFGKSIEKKNAFFEAVGELPPMTRTQADLLFEIGSEKSFDWFRNAIKV